MGNPPHRRPELMSEHRNRIYHLTGNPFEIGYALGGSLGPRLEANIRRYVRERVSPDVPFDAQSWRSGALLWLRTLPARFQDEFAGLAQGAQLPLQRLSEWAYLEVVLSGRCSGAVVTIDGQAWVARNNDFWVPGMWGYVTIREVAGRIPTITFGMEGDVFTPTGVNRDKLWLHYNYMAAWDAPTAGNPHLPCYVLLVEALETCRTLEDVEALLGRIQRDDGMLLFAVDGKDNTYALYECGCANWHKREPTNGWVVGTNHSCMHPQAPAPGDLGPLGTVRRYERLEVLVEGLVSQGGCVSPVQELVRILADDGVEAREGETVTVYSNVACPSVGEIWYTFGGYPAASHGNWHKLDWPW